MGDNFLINNISQMLSPLKTLTLPLTSVACVTTEIAEVLKHFGTITIQDLATSRIFYVASIITESADPTLRAGQILHGQISSEIIPRSD